MEQRTQRIGLVNLVALLVVGTAAYLVARYGNTLAGMTGSVFLGIGFLVAAISWFQARLEDRERLEKLEFDELTRSAASSALFNPAESEVFPAQRSREQFEKYFVPTFTVLLFLLQAGGALLLWRWLLNIIPTPLEQSKLAGALFGLFALILFMLGKYSTSVARLNQLRLLRPGAGYLLFSAYVCAFVALGIVAVIFGFPQVDVVLASVLAGVLLLIGVETLITLILELYRPRVKGRVERPVYESRLVSLLGQPEGLITTAAQTLDYQFGFKVSETWAYRLFVQWLPWLIWSQLIVLLLSTCVVFISTGEQAVLEHFGQPVAVLDPGAHFKWPWPVDRIRRFPTQRIQTFDVGYTPDAASATNKLVLWTIPHTKEENFLVANRSTASEETGTNNDTTTRPPPVSLLTVSIPVQFQITNLTQWVYNNEEPDTLLQHIARREVVRYLVSADMEEVMSRVSGEAASVLRDRIQAEANRHEMGANIVFVGLQDIHPPVKVAPDYEKVMAAIHTREANIIDAQAHATATNTLADADAFKIRSEAHSDQRRREVDAQARAALFTNQLPAYLAAPSVYLQRAYLQAFTQSVTNARKYVLLATNTQDVIIMNLEDKISKDMLEGLSIPPPTNRPAAK